MNGCAPGLALMKWTIHMSNFHPGCCLHVKYWSLTEIISCIFLTSNQIKKQLPLLSYPNNVFFSCVYDYTDHNTRVLTGGRLLESYPFCCLWIHSCYCKHWTATISRILGSEYCRGTPGQWLREATKRSVSDQQVWHLECCIPQRVLRLQKSR